MAQPQMFRPIQVDYATWQSRQEVDQWLVEELHDGVAQSLWYLGVELSALDREISPQEARLRDQVKTLGEVAREAYEQVRAILGHSWSAGGPSDTLDDVVRRESQLFEKRTGARIRLSLGPVRYRATGWQAHHLAAIVREALCNAWRHGQTRCIQVEMEATAERVSVKITDEGVGFDSQVFHEGHYGMATMQKRAQAMGGVLEVFSQACRGTRVELTLPIAAPGE